MLWKKKNPNIRGKNNKQIQIHPRCSVVIRHTEQEHISAFVYTKSNNQNSCCKIIVSLEFNKEG